MHTILVNIVLCIHKGRVTRAIAAVINKDTMYASVLLLLRVDYADICTLYDASKHRARTRPLDGWDQ